jgi:hypothetical protein
MFMEDRPRQLGRVYFVHGRRSEKGRHLRRRACSASAHGGGDRDGELILSPRPASRHGAAASTLGEELGPPFKRGRGGPGGWLIVDEPELHFAGNVLVPDLAGWRRERMALLPDAPFLTLAPDWICEVLVARFGALRSQEEDAPLRSRRRAQRLAAGSGGTDPGSLPSGRRAWSLLATFSDDERVRAEPFDAIELDLGLLWADVEPAAAK